MGDGVLGSRLRAHDHCPFSILRGQQSRSRLLCSSSMWYAAEGGRGKREVPKSIIRTVCLNISSVRVILVVEVSHVNVVNVKECVGPSPEFAKPTNSDVLSDTAGWFTHPPLTTLNRGHCGDDLRIYGPKPIDATFIHNFDQLGMNTVYGSNWMRRWFDCAKIFEDTCPEDGSGIHILHTDYGTTRRSASPA